MSWGQSEGANEDSNPIRGFPWEDKKTKIFLWKDLTTSLWPLVSSQNKRLTEYQRRASQLPDRAFRLQRQRGRQVVTRAGRQGVAAVLDLETASSTKLRAGSQLLTSSYWNLVQLTSARSFADWDQLHRGETWHPWDGALTAHPGDWAARTRQVNKMHSPPGAVRWPSTHLPELLGPGKDTKFTAHLGLCPCTAPERLSGLDLGSARNAGPTWDSVLAQHPGDWAV